MVNSSELFKKDIFLINEIVSSDYGHKKIEACSIFIGNGFIKYTNDYTDDLYLELENTLIKSKSDIWMYRVLCILDFKGFDFKNINKVFELCAKRNFYNSLDFLRIKGDEFYTTLKLINPDLIYKTIFLNDDVLFDLYRIFEKCGIRKIDDKLVELKKIISENIFINENEFDYRGFNYILKNQDNLRQLVALFKHKLESFNDYMQYKRYDWDLFKRIYYRLTDYGYNFSTTTTDRTPNDEMLGLIDMVKYVKNKFNIKEDGVQDVYKLVDFIGNETRISDELFKMINNQDYTTLRKRVDDDEEIVECIKKSTDILFKSISSHKGILFLKFLVNRKILSIETINDNVFKIDLKEIKQEVQSFVEKYNFNKTAEKLDVKRVINYDKDNLTHYVYFFYDKNNELLYVGKTNNIDKRMDQHFKNSHLGDVVISKIDKINYIKTLSDNEACIYEIYYIDKLNPMHNTVNNISKGLSFNLPDKTKLTYDHSKHLL